MSLSITATTCNIVSMEKMWHSKETHRDPEHFPIPKITKEGEKAQSWLAFWQDEQVYDSGGEAEDLHIYQTDKGC